MVEESEVDTGTKDYSQDVDMAGEKKLAYLLSIPSFYYLKEVKEKG